MSTTPPQQQQTIHPSAIQQQATILRRAVKPLYFVTSNKNKLIETSRMLADTIPDLRSVSIDLPELQGDSPESISREKCRIASQHMGEGVPVIVEDTALCFTALNGLPGPYIKWFLDKTGHDGLNNLLAAYPDKSAYAMAVFSFTDSPTTEPITFVGKCHGKIVPPRVTPGKPVFGWDPIFQPDGFPTTFGEMDKSEKDSISHRSRAIDAMKVWVNQHTERFLGLPEVEEDEKTGEDVNTPSDDEGCDDKTTANATK